MTGKLSQLWVSILLLTILAACAKLTETPIPPTDTLEPTTLPTLIISGVEKTVVPTVDRAPLLPSGEVITLENVQDLKLLGTLGKSDNNIGYSGADVAFSPDGNILAVAYLPGPVRLYDVATFAMLAELKTQINYPHSVVFSPDGKLVAAGGGRYPLPGRVQIWDVETHEKILSIDDFEDHVWAIAFSPNGRIFATGEGNGWGGPGCAKVWDVATGELLSKFGLRSGYYSVFDVAFNPEGTLLATANANGQVQFWDVAKNSEYKVMTGVSGRGYGIAFSPDGKLFAVSGAKSSHSNETLDLRLWDLATGELVFKVESPGYGDMRISFSPNGQILASTMFDSTFLFDVETGNTLVTLSGGESVAFSPDGTLIAIGLFDVALWGIPTH